MARAGPVPDSGLIGVAVERLRAGELVAFPTETVYGLGADALNPEAVARVFAAKGRPASNPLIVHCADEAMARGVAGAWPDDAVRLAAAFWPGPLTIILPKGPGVPDAVTAGGPTVGLRVPDHPVALALLRAFGGPLVGPSANPSGRTSPTTAEHVRSSFTEREVMVLDGGPARAGIESTVVALGPSPVILRPGVVTAAELSGVLNRPVGLAGEEDAGADRASPGRRAVHYAPHAPAVLFEGAEVTGLAPAGQRIVVLSHIPMVVPGPHTLIPMPARAGEYAAALYAALRRADALQPCLIAIRRVPEDGPDQGLWLAIRDRLHRATAASRAVWPPEVA